jgi:hypothetical protein
MARPNPAEEPVITTTGEFSIENLHIPCQNASLYSDRMLNFDSLNHPRESFAIYSTKRLRTKRSEEI